MQKCNITLVNVKKKNSELERGFMMTGFARQGGQGWFL